MTTSKQQQQIDWRRSQVLEFASKGYSQSDIARILQIDKSVICRDITVLIPIFLGISIPSFDIISSILYLKIGRAVLISQP
jgi:hypothetical protein